MLKVTIGEVLIVRFNLHSVLNSREVKGGKSSSLITDHLPFYSGFRFILLK